MSQEVSVPTARQLAEQSAATPEFRAALAEFEKSQRGSDAIRFSPGNPPVKVLRVICQLLDSQPELAIRQVEVRGASGCSDYRGDVLVNGGERRFRFVWDCAWKAEQVGWKDYFGSPDQIRAARTFGYQCFEVFEEVR